MSEARYALILKDNSGLETVLNTETTEFSIFHKAVIYLINHLMKEELTYYLHIYRARFFHKTVLNKDESICIAVNTTKDSVDIEIAHKFSENGYDLICTIRFHNNYLSINYHKVNIGSLFKNILYLISDVCKHIQFMVATDNGTKIGW